MGSGVEFGFEQEVLLTEDDYARIMALAKPGTRLWRGAGLTFLGLLCLWSPYTLLLGVLVLSLVVLTLFIPRVLPFGARLTYRDSPHLHEPVTYAVTEKELSATSAALRVFSTWDNLRVWRLADDWLVLSPSGMPPLFLSVIELRRAGVYDHVMELARKHGKEFGRPRR